MSDDKFLLKEDHIKLVRKMRVGWNELEFGAPTIDPKRPYGNSDVFTDMYKILEKNISVSELSKLHEETRLALEIILDCGVFCPGYYKKDSDGWHFMHATSQ
jgi:hypothetical protein